MKKLRKLKKGLAVLLAVAMVVGLMPGMGNMKVSAEEEGSATVTFTALDGNPVGVYDERFGTDNRYYNLLDGKCKFRLI